MHFRPFLGASALAVLASAPAAFADVTAADVWQQWQDYVAKSGQTITAGSEDMSGGTLTLTDVTMGMANPEMTVSATIPQITMTENGDGTVSIELPDSYPMVLDIMPPDEDPVKVMLTLSQTAMTMTASGTPEAMAYDYAADSVALTLDKVEAAGAADTTATGSLTLAGLTGTYGFGDADPQPVTSTFAADSLNFTVDVDAPSQNGALSLTANIADLDGSGDSVMPASVDYADMAATLAAGFQTAVDVTMGATSYDFSFQDGADTMSGKASLDSGAVTFGMSSDGLTYNTSGNNFDLAFSGSQIPFPEVTLKMAETGFGLTMPVAKSDTPQDAALLLKLVGLQIQDEIWGMVDPGGALPHDPATLIVDLSGTANWLIDIMAPDAEQGMAEMGMPAQIHTLDVNEVELTAAGASLTGDGAFTFDNEDLMTWGGMPAPDGTLNLSLTGANALIDKLVTMGLVPQDQAMGAKMMMGMFAKPGAEPDSLTSEIKVTKDGHIFANGQQLQ